MLTEEQRRQLKINRALDKFVRARKSIRRGSKLLCEVSQAIAGMAIRTKTAPDIDVNAEIDAIRARLVIINSKLDAIERD